MKKPSDKPYDKPLSAPEIAGMSEERIDFSDIPELDDRFWQKAQVRVPDHPKKQITVRLDSDVVEWFKAQGRGYQTRMNAVLRSYYEAHKTKP